MGSDTSNQPLERFCRVQIQGMKASATSSCQWIATPVWHTRLILRRRANGLEECGVGIALCFNIIRGSVAKSDL